MGVQDLTAHSFATQRSIGTGSWLGRDVQGHGLGTEMRAAALALAFDGLGAVEAHSGYIEGNAASARVSERLGYLANGVRVRRLGPGGEPVTEHLVRVTPATWRRDLVRVAIEGLEPCLALFGAGDLPPTDWATL